VQNLEGLFLWSNGEPREATEYWVGGERKLQLRRAEIIDERVDDRDKEHAAGGSRVTYFFSFSLLLAILIAAGGLYYKNELRRAQEIDLIVRGLNSQQQEIDRAQQSVSLLYESLNSTAQDSAARKDQVDNSIKQLRDGLHSVEQLIRSMQSRIDSVEKKEKTVANSQTAPAADGENERKP